MKHAEKMWKPVLDLWGSKQCSKSAQLDSTKLVEVTIVVCDERCFVQGVLIVDPLRQRWLTAPTLDVATPPATSGRVGRTQVQYSSHAVPPRRTSILSGQAPLDKAQDQVGTERNMLEELHQPTANTHS